jgi:hypothetical protein
LISAGGGTAYGWSSNFDIYQKDSKTAKKKQLQDDGGGGLNKIEIIIKNSVINSIQYDDEFDILFYSTDEGRVELYSTEGGRGIKAFLMLNYDDCQITALKLAK